MRHVDVPPAPPPPPRLNRTREREQERRDARGRVILSSRTPSRRFYLLATSDESDDPSGAASLPLRLRVSHPPLT